MEMVKAYIPAKSLRSKVRENGLGEIVRVYLELSGRREGERGTEK
jgi:hypothetical protein